VIGRSRDNAIRRLSAARTTRAARRKPGPKTGSRCYWHASSRVLQRVWVASGGMCGNCLAAATPGLLTDLEAHGHRAPEGRDRCNAQTRAELLAISAAAIDRYLAPRRRQTPYATARDWAFVR
jgi:hypothetical protein